MGKNRQVFKISTIFTEERLSDCKHLRKVSNFTCGENKELEDFLKSDAFAYNREGQGNTYLILDKEGRDIIGYYTLRANAIQAYNDDNKRVEILPAIEIARFAIAADYQGKGYGRLIFFFSVLPKINKIKSIVGVNTIMLFSVNTEQALGFYEKIGFKITEDEVRQFINEDCNKGCKLMYVNIENTKPLLDELNRILEELRG